MQNNTLHFWSSIGIAALLHFLIVVVWGNNLLNINQTEIPFRTINIKLTPNIPLNKTINTAKTADKISSDVKDTVLVKGKAKYDQDKQKGLEEMISQSVDYNNALLYNPPLPKKKKIRKNIRRSMAANDSGATYTNIENPVPYRKPSAPLSQVKTSPELQHKQDRVDTVTIEERKIIMRYEQLISAWLARFRPNNLDSYGFYGDILIRMQINRFGDILFYKFEKISGIRDIDYMVSQMVEAANPLPPVPAKYPGSERIEFIIPIRFN